ncbi:MAG: sigma-54-dependent Fis family transcriptional regulator [Myxococcales bacterium]|nr:sigma-54 dependent transcriptional regulator [Deltaproteobacteria bacterium]NND30048.1 sigma-54-dependent Fis family transcriptional regulator [Myxococcales bacterium]
MSETEDRQPTVLVVDDKKNMLSLMKKVLRADARVLTAERGLDALKILEAEPVDVVLCDLRMPDTDGVEVLKLSKRVRPQAEFILMTAYASVATAVEALRLGAYDYLIKPFDPQTGRAVVLRAMGRAATALPGAETRVLDDEVLPDMLARSSAMRELSQLVKRVAVSDATVLLLGETGTGKERVARALHRLSDRSSQRFVAVNCAAIPAELLESELFGYVKGSFTGANRDRPGLFEEANGGTLFLDEIGEMRLSLQAKLTRALEERAIRRLGESAERKIDARVIAATHRDIEAMVQNESFREDLWYRLNVAVVRIPPLRERRDDIELLAAHFLRELPRSRDRRLVGFTPAAVEAMEQYDWPGNVRQLRAAVERASVVSTAERIDVGDLPPEVVKVAAARVSNSRLGTLTWAEAQTRGRREIARRYLKEVLRRHGGQVGEAAAQAGVERESFYRLLRRYGIQPDEYRGTGHSEDKD